MYKIEFTRNAAKQIEKIFKIDQKLYFRLMAAAESLKLNPLLGKKLKGRLGGNYSLRVGDYRIIYSVLKDRLIIYIIDLGHRKEIYR